MAARHVDMVKAKEFLVPEVAKAVKLFHDIPGSRASQQKIDAYQELVFESNGLDPFLDKFKPLTFKTFVQHATIGPFIRNYLARKPFSLSFVADLHTLGEIGDLPKSSIKWILRHTAHLEIVEPESGTEKIYVKTLREYFKSSTFRILTLYKFTNDNINTLLRSSTSSETTVVLKYCKIKELQYEKFKFKHLILFHCTKKNKMIERCRQLINDAELLNLKQKRPKISLRCITNFHQNTHTSVRIARCNKPHEDEFFMEHNALDLTHDFCETVASYGY